MGGTDADESDAEGPGPVYFTETETEAESQGTLNRGFDSDPPPSLGADSREDNATNRCTLNCLLDKTPQLNKKTH